MTKKALIAGWGDLPYLWAKRAEAAEEDFIIIKIAEEITSDFYELDVEEYTVNLTQFSKIIKIVEENEVEEILWLGKIQKAHLFDDFSPDPFLEKILAGLPNFNDDTILFALAKEFLKRGMDLLPQSYLLEDHLAQAGLLAGIPDSKTKKDMRFAFETAYNLGRFDIGQTALIKDGAVMALEAIEGTDEAIKRAAKYAGPGLVMGKCSKKEQDFRFDIPTVGLKTLNNLIEAEAKALIIEANKTFILNREEFCQKAAANNIIVAAAEFNEGELNLPC